MNKFEKQPARDINYLYEDEDIIAVSKPAWLLSVPGRGEDKWDSVATRVQSRHIQAQTVHRLDWATSGIMIMAKHKEAQKNINKQFAQRKTRKRYIAIVSGLVKPEQQTITLPLRCDWENRPRQIVDFEQGKPSETHLTVDCHQIENKRSRLILKPVTGRSHQLRVHCQQIGHPIIGDRLYADKAHQEITENMLLHAEWLEIYHPRTGEIIEFLDPSPF